MADQGGTGLDLDGDIWRFALDFHGAPNIADLCVRLQDEAGVDVIALIAVLYAYVLRQRRLSAADIGALGADMRSWRDETVLPLRRLRRGLKSPPAGFPSVETEMLRKIIHKAELKAEQIQLALAERWLRQRPSSPDGLPLARGLGLLADAEPESIRVLLERAIAAARDVAGST